MLNYLYFDNFLTTFCLIYQNIDISLQRKPIQSAPYLLGQPEQGRRANNRTREKAGGNAAETDGPPSRQDSTYHHQGRERPMTAYEGARPSAYLYIIICITQPYRTTAKRKL